MKINIKAEGVNRLKQRLQSQANNLLNLQPLWQLVGMYVQKQTIKERFYKEQAPDGSKWQPLSQARIKQRLKRHKSGNMKILQDTGELRRSVQYEAGQTYVRIGSNLKYARIHQFGGTINIKQFRTYKKTYSHYVIQRSVTVPARPFLGVTPNEQQHINDMFRAYLKRHVFAGG